MIKKLLIIATLVAGLISNQAKAEFIQTDWKVAGDSQATLQVSTGLEWLDLYYTRGWSINQASNALSTSLSGWRLATQSEVTALWEEILGVKLGSTRQMVATTNKVELNYLGRHSAFGYLYTSGRFVGDNGVVRDAGALLTSGGRLEYYHLWNSGLTMSNSTQVQGIYLVSDGGTTLSSINDPKLNINNPNAPINMADVSAPAGLAAAGVLMLMLGARRKVA